MKNFEPSIHPALELDAVSKSFAHQTSAKDPVISSLSFQVRNGEFFSILGPSGCGKTTLLRMISGIEQPSSGHIRMNGKVVNHIHPHQRNVHMVFQKYALFPHLNVFENVAFGLKMKKVDLTEIKVRVAQMLKLVHLEGYERRSIDQLSGGEQQRIALIRALISKPDILLLDEPLGALDQKLREALQQELAQIQKEMKTTFILVTHDQSEALMLSDRVAIMNKGRIEQVGTPAEVYENPVNTFVAQFVGTGNLIEGQLMEETTPSLVQVQTRRLGRLTAKLADSASVKKYQTCTVLVRPEKIRVRVSGPDQNNPQLNVMRGVLAERIYSGPITQVKMQISEGNSLQVMIPNQVASKMPTLRLGERYYIVWDAQDSTVLVQ